MKRVLGWTCWISGGMLLLLTVTLGQMRDHDHLSNPILISADAAPNVGQDYYLFLPETRTHHRLLLENPAAVFDRRIGQWLYFYERTPTGQFLLYRVRLNGLCRQDILVVDYPQNPVWSGGWIYYRYPNSAGDYDLWRIRNDGKQAQNLTMGQGVNLSPSLIMPRGGWVYFKATVSPNGSIVAITGIYRVRVDGTDFQYLSSQLPSVYGLLLVDPNGEWMIVSWQNGLYVMATDGSHYESLPAPPPGVGQRYEYAQLVNNTLVVTGGSYGFLLRLDTHQVFWDFGQPEKYSGVWSISPSGEWAYLKQLDFGVIAVRIDGSASEVLPTTQNTLWDVLGWTPDGAWLLFQVSDGDIQELRRISADHQITETLYRAKLTGSPPQLSLDGRWVYFQVEAGSSGNLTLFRMRPDGSRMEDLSSELPFISMTYHTDIELPTPDFRPTWLSLAAGGFVFIAILTGRERKII